MVIRTKVQTILITQARTKWRQDRSRQGQLTSCVEIIITIIRPSLKISSTRALIATTDPMEAPSKGTINRLWDLRAAATLWWLELMVDRVHHLTISFQHFSRASAILSRTLKGNIFQVLAQLRQETCTTSRLSKLLFDRKWQTNQMDLEVQRWISTKICSNKGIMLGVNWNQFTLS